MNDRARLLIPAAILAGAVVVAGCAGAAASHPAATSAAPSAVPSSIPGASETATPATGSVDPAPSAPAASASPAGVTLNQDWATAELVDVTTGETFRIADHAGKVVILETMAIWCSNCRAQQRDVRTALEQLSADAVTYIVPDSHPENFFN